MSPLTAPSRRWILGGAAAVAAAALALFSIASPGTVASPAVEDRPTESNRFTHGGTEVEVTFRGEVGHGDLFADGEAFTGEGGVVRPVGADGEPTGEVEQPRPTWLSFTYRMGDEQTDLLVAKQPVMNTVSWNAIARAGAALGGEQTVDLDGEAYPQDAVVQAADGHDYRARLLRCGQSTTGPLSEWNLLVGAVHQGDQDFRGERYGWITGPYADEDLVVGFHGSLSWCENPWRGNPKKRVVRGYFKVSRFHATAPGFAGGRVRWRPVLERIDPAPEQRAPEPKGLEVPARPQISPDRQVRYFGPIDNGALFGDGETIAELVGLDDAGKPLSERHPQWLRFQFEGDTLLVAARSLRRSLSWDAIARAGAARGDGSEVQVGGDRYPQDAEVSDIHGNRYRVRLLDCGTRTLDTSSEWNRLIGGVHRGDGDFVARPDGVYGWIERPVPDRALGIIAGHGAATWCDRTEEIDGDRYGVNRGYLTVARYHLTPSDFEGSGFGWRPVLELIPAD